MFQCFSPLKDSRGQALIEYVILVALVGVATIGMVRLLQKTVNVNLARTVDALQGRKDSKQAYETVNDDDVRKKDFKDFMNGASSK
jgi:pilus assembly protein Flp/PilA